MDAYERITNEIMDMLEQGDIPWHRPWNGTLKNLKTGHDYRGINIWLLGGRKYTSPYWLTFKQAKEMGGSVKAGEKSTMVVFWKLLTRMVDSPILDDNGEIQQEEKVIPLLRTYNVFNVAQTTIPVPEIENKDIDPKDIRDKRVAIEKAPPFLMDIEGAGLTFTF